MWFSTARMSGWFQKKCEIYFGMIRAYGGKGTKYYFFGITQKSV